MTSVASPNDATQLSRPVPKACLVEFRVRDFRDVDDGPFDTISSIGMSEHVGRRSLAGYCQLMFDLLAPVGRFLNHAIGQLVRFDEAGEASSERARRLYMSGSAVGFERYHLEIHQTLCVRPDAGLSKMATTRLRTDVLTSHFGP